VKFVSCEQSSEGEHTLAECTVVSWQSVFCRVSRTKSSSTLLNSGALNQVGDVVRPLSGDVDCIMMHSLLNCTL